MSSSAQKPEPAAKEYKSLQLSSCPEKVCVFQRRQANVLELAYTYVADYPNVAEKIRLASHDARSYQMESCGVMKSVQIAADHMHGIMIPTVLEAIEDKDSDLIKETIDMSLAVITDVQQKTVALKDSFAQFSKELEKVKEDLKRDKIQTAKENKRLELEISEQQKQAENHASAMARLEQEKAEMLEEIKRWKQKREELLDKTEEDGNDEAGRQYAMGIFGVFLGGACSVAATVVAPVVFAAAGTAITLGTSYISSTGIRTTNRETINQMVAQISEAEESARKNNLELRKVDHEQDERELALFKNQRKAKEFEMEKGLLCDTASLDKALQCSAQLNGQYEFLTLFWGDMIAAFGQLNNEIKTGRLFQSLRRDEYISNLKTLCQDASKKWMFMSETSGKVEQAIRNNVGRNFAFMSKDYDSMKPDERNDRITKLEQSIGNLKLDGEN